MPSLRSGRFRTRPPLFCLFLLLILNSVACDSSVPSDSGTLSITEPAPNATLREERVVIRGQAQPGAEIALDLRLSGDPKVKADAEGRWEISQKLEQGKNEFSFHLTAQQDVKAEIVVFYEPPVSAPAPSPTPTTAIPTPTLAMPTPPPPTLPPAPAPMADQVAKSYRDNLNFLGSATAEGLDIVWAEADGLLTINVTPRALFSEGTALTVAGASAIVASRAVWTTYPSVSEISLLLWTDFTDQNGNTKKEIAALLSVTRPTAEKFDYDGLKGRALSDNKLFFCTVDRYRLHPAVYNALGNKGCLAQWGASKP